MKKKYKILTPIASLALLIVLMPTLVSTHIGTKVTLSLVNRLSSTNITVSELSLSWLGTQEIKDLKYKDVSKGAMLTCQAIRLDMGLLQAVFFSKDFNSLEIRNPHLQVASTFLSSPQKIDVPLKQASFYPQVGSIEIVKQKLTGYEGVIHIKDGTLEVKIEGSPNITFAPIELEATLNAKEKNYSAFIQIDTVEGESKGHLSLKGSIDKNLSLQVSSSNFPLNGADQVLNLLEPKYQGALVSILGPNLDIECEVIGKDNFFNAKLNLQSQNVRVGLQVNSKEQGIDVTSPGFAEVWLTPKSNQKLSFLYPNFPLLTEKETIVLSCTVDSLHVPVKDGQLLTEEASFTSSFSSLPYFITPEIKANVKGKLSSTLLKEKISAEMNLEMEAEKDFSRLSLIGTLDAPLTKEPSLEGSLVTQKIPTSILNSFCSFPPSDVLGSWIEAKGNIKGTLTSSNLSLQMESPLFFLSDASFRWEDKELNLMAPLAFTYKVQPALVTNLISKEILLKDPITAQVDISKFTFSKDLFLESKISLEPLFFTKLFSLQNYSLPPLQIQAGANTLAKIHVQAKSDIFSLDSNVKLEDSKLTLTAPLEIGYTLKKQDALLAKLPFVLLEEATAKFIFNPTSLLLEEDLKKSKLRANLEVTPLKMKNKENGKELTLQKITSDISFSGPKEEVDFSFQVDVSDLKVQNSLKGSGSLQKVLSSSDLEFFTCTLNADHLSLALIEEFYAAPFSFSPYIGDTVTASVTVEKNPALESFSIQAETPVLKIKGSLAREKDRLFFQKGSSPFLIEYTLTPMSYKAISKDSPFALKEKSLFTASVTDLNIPFSPGSHLPDLTGMKINSLISNDQIIFQRQGSLESLTLAGSKISLEKKASQKELTLNIDAKAKTSSKEEGTLHLDVVLSKFLNEQGNFTLSDLHLVAQAKALRFPSTALDAALSLKKEPFSLMLGPTFEASLSMALQNGNGPLSFDLRSNKAHVDFVGTVDQGNLKLVKDLKADLLLTHELGKFILEEGNVSSIKSFYAPAPITVQIASKGFSFPLDSMDKAQIQAPFMRIDLGKLYCKNEGAMVNFLRQLRSNEPEGKEIQIWVAPMDIHIKSGILELERTEILLDKSYDVALWGEVDIPGNYIDMVFGLTAEALQQAFGVTDLPENYVIKIPIKGPLNDVKIKTGSATSKITALLLWKSKALDSALPFGGILKKVVPPPGDGKAPPPKTPFPWEVSR